MPPQNIETKQYCDFQRPLKLKLSFSVMRLMTGPLFKLFDLRQIVLFDPFSRTLTAKQRWKYLQLRLPLGYQLL